MLFYGKSEHRETVYILKSDLLSMINIRTHKVKPLSLEVIKNISERVATISNGLDLLWPLYWLTCAEMSIGTFLCVLNLSASTATQAHFNIF
jgi:hypothetical protein